jgi:hypothetical protein
MVDSMGEVQALVGYHGRGPGTDAERRAARHLAARLEKLDRDAEIQPTRIAPNWALTHALHALLGVVGSVVSVYNPPAGAAIVLVAFLSTLGDLTGSFLLLRRLTGMRASQNVVSEEDEGKPGLLILVAHYDASRGGLAFNRRIIERRAAFGKLIRRPIGEFGLFFWSLGIVLVCAIARVGGIDSTALTIVQFVPTVFLIASIALLADIALAPVVPGANDNASGVATVLRLAERYGGQLENFDLWVILTGAEEGFALGMRDWVKRNRKQLDAEATAVVCVDMAGHGTPKFARKEGLIFPSAYHPALTELAAAAGAKPYVSRLMTDSYPARAAGLPAIRISALNALDVAPHYHQPTDTPDRIDPEALERTFEFCCDFIESIDAEIGPRL